MGRTKVAALVPAYNEADNIEKTIHSLMSQSYRFEKVIIIANNCSDDTVSIVRKLRSSYKKAGRHELQLLIMKNNRHKKSGALNYGLNRLPKNIKYVFGMDADTIVDENMVKAAINQFKKEPQTAGICSAYRTLPLKKSASAWERFLWRLQNIEFTLANAWRVENYKSARVLPGVSVMFKMEALKDVAAFELMIESHEKQLIKKFKVKKLTTNQKRQVRLAAIHEFKELKLKKGSVTKYLKNQKMLKVWATNHLVEDYRLTLDLKDIGWDVKSSLMMISWSDVPLKLVGKGGLWDQRQRWYSGTVDELRQRHFMKHSRYEIFTISLLMVNLIMTIILFSAYAILIFAAVHIKILSLFFILPILASMTQLYRLKGGDQLDKWQKFFTATLIVNEMYAFFRELVYAYSIWVSYFNPDREW